MGPRAIEWPYPGPISSLKGGKMQRSFVGQGGDKLRNSSIEKLGISHPLKIEKLVFLSAESSVLRHKPLS